MRRGLCEVSVRYKKPMVARVGFEPTYGKPGQIYSLLLLTAQPPGHYRLRTSERGNYSTHEAR